MTPAPDYADVGSGIVEGSVAAKVGGFYEQSAHSVMYCDLGWMMTLASWRSFRTLFFPEFTRWCLSGNVGSTLRMLNYRGKDVVVHGARRMERRMGLSKQEFFDAFGFVLLPHQSAMSESDWLDSGQHTTGPQSGMTASEQAKIYMSADTPARRIYAQECAQLVRQIQPDAREIVTLPREYAAVPAATSTITQRPHTPTFRSTSTVQPRVIVRSRLTRIAIGLHARTLQPAC